MTILDVSLRQLWKVVALMAWIGLQDWRCQSWSHWISICEILSEDLCDRSSDQPTSAEVGKSTLLNKMTGSASEVPPQLLQVGCIDSVETCCSRWLPMSSLL